MSEHVVEARRLRSRHDDAFYGPMEDEACGCDLCLWLSRYLTVADRAERAEAALREIESLPNQSEHWHENDVAVRIAREALARREPRDIDGDYDAGFKDGLAANARRRETAENTLRELLEWTQQTSSGTVSATGLAARVEAALFGHEQPA